MSLYVIWARTTKTVLLACWLTLWVNKQDFQLRKIWQYARTKQNICGKKSILVLLLGLMTSIKPTSRLPTSRPSELLILKNWMPHPLLKQSRISFKSKNLNEIPVWLNFLMVQAPWVEHATAIKLSLNRPNHKLGTFNVMHILYILC